MAEAKKNILTYEGLQKLEAELEDLKVNKRKEVAAKIKEAREQGDLSKRVIRETYQKMPNMMLQRMSREILKQELKK